MSKKQPPKKRNALGRGLGALLEDSPPSERQISGEKASGTSAFGEIPLENIEVNPFQPRKNFDETALGELAESIKTQGIIQPITVRKLSRDKYQLISGERRFQASKVAGLEAVPAYIRSADDQQMLEMALIENIQRENLNAIEIALSYQRLMDECSLKQEQLGDRVGKNRTTINNYLRLLRLPPDIQIAVRDGHLSMGHARAIITIDNVDTQLDLFKRIISEDLSVRKVEALARDLAAGKKQKQSDQKETPNQEEVFRLQQRMASHFGTRVNIKSDGKKGEIKIPFVSIEDLNRILDIIDM
jgi:ParB family chromosome partitioning protein